MICLNQNPKDFERRGAFESQNPSKARMKAANDADDNMPHELDDEPKIENPEILTWKDIVFPAIYIGLILILLYFVLKLLSPFIALALGGIVAYIHLLRDFFKHR